MRAPASPTPAAWSPTTLPTPVDREPRVGRRVGGSRESGFVTASGPRAAPSPRRTAPHRVSAATVRRRLLRAQRDGRHRAVDRRRPCAAPIDRAAADRAVVDTHRRRRRCCGSRPCSVSPALSFDGSTIVWSTGHEIRRYVRPAAGGAHDVRRASTSSPPAIQRSSPVPISTCRLTAPRWCSSPARARCPRT